MFCDGEQSLVALKRSYIVPKKNMLSLPIPKQMSIQSDQLATALAKLLHGWTYEPFSRSWLIRVSFVTDVTDALTYRARPVRACGLQGAPKKFQPKNFFAVFSAIKLEIQTAKRSLPTTNILKNLRTKTPFLKIAHSSIAKQLNAKEMWPLHLPD